MSKKVLLGTHPAAGSLGQQHILSNAIIDATFGGSLVETTAVRNGRAVFQAKRTTGSGAGHSGHRVYTPPLLHCVLDGATDLKNRDVIWTFRERAEFEINTAFSTIASEGYIGFNCVLVGAENNSSLRVGIGFRAKEGESNWRCMIRDSNDAESVFRDLLDVLTTKSYTTMRTLEIVVDGRPTVRTVTFYIDGDEVAKHDFQTAGDYLDRQGAPGNQGLYWDVFTDGVGEATLHMREGGVYESFVHEYPEAVAVNLSTATTSQLTYQRVLNLARTRAPQFSELVLDDMQVIDELNAITLELISEGSEGDHSAFQELLLWSTDVKPLLPATPVVTDLRDVTEIRLPSWVNSAYAIQAVDNAGKKRIVDVRKYEDDIRLRRVAYDSALSLDELEDRTLERPRAWRVWDPANQVWVFKKDTLGVTNPWANMLDAEIIVSGVRTPMTNRGDLTDAIPVPYRAMTALVEAYALLLGGRTGMPLPWMNTQRAVKQMEWDRFREFIQLVDMTQDEPYDPEIGW